MLINLTNHPSTKWPADQKKAADVFGEVVDFAFPYVSSDLDGQSVDSLRDETLGRVMPMIRTSGDAVLVQGEYVLTYRLVNALKEKSVKVLSATSERVTDEYINDQGDVVKTARFRFVQFREY